MKNLIVLIAFQFFCFPAFSENYTLSGDNNGSLSRSGRVLSFHWYYNNRKFDMDLILGDDFEVLQSYFTNQRGYNSDYRKRQFNDPGRNIIHTVAQFLKDRSEENGYDTGEFILHFVQALRYDDNNHQIERFPSETLIDYAGDCSDTALLYASLMQEINISNILLQYKQGNHLAVGIWSNDRNGTYYPYIGRKYYYCETTGSGFAFGEAPEDTVAEEAVIIP